MNNMIDLQWINWSNGTNDIAAKWRAGGLGFERFVSELHMGWFTVGIKL